MRDKDLDDLLGMAARHKPAPSPKLMDRVLADALALQPQPAEPAGRARPGLLARLSMAFGGAPVLAGLCSSVILGLAVGYMNPVTIDYLTGGLTGAEAEALDLFPSDDFLTTEG